VLNPLTATADPIVAGQTITVSGAFTDAGTNDTHTSTVDWGDLSTSGATVSETVGSGTTTATHSYALPGIYTVSVDVNDGDGGIATRTVQIRVNTPPTADAGGPYAGPEGTMLTLGGSATDPDPDVLTTSWSFVVTGAPPSACTFGATNTLTPTILCTDNASIAATLSVSDGVHSPVTSVATLTVGNVAPTVGALVATPSIQAVGASVSVSAGFTDVGTNDTHSALVDWGDASSSAATVTESAGAGTATGAHVYADAGIYTVSMTVTDDDTGTATVSTTVVVYDPTGPFVTASGKFSSPSGAYTPDNPSDPNVVGTAQMQFVAKYHTGDTVPTGNGSFRFEAAGLDLDATGFVWLVVTDAGDEAFFRGTGTVNGSSGYEFLVSGIDGSPDLVRIKVWESSTGTVVYDSQPGAPDDADPTTPLSSGEFIVH
jgi:PKD repeat protein